MSVLSGNLKKARNASGFTQQQMADFFGVTRGAVAQWESGVTSPETSRLLDIAEYLDTTIAALFDKPSPDQEPPEGASDMECKFHVGQKVVCIDPHNTSWQRRTFLGVIPYTLWWSELVEGEVYTVSDVFVGKDMAGRTDVALHLAEMNNYEESGFRASRFRPVSTRETDISIFKAMLISKNERVDA